MDYSSSTPVPYAGYTGGPPPPSASPNEKPSFLPPGDVPPPVVWKASAWDWPLIALGNLMLLIWIGGAIYLVLMDDAHPFREPDILERWSNGKLSQNDYNTIIQVLASVSAVFIGIAMTTCWRMILSHQIMSSKGITLKRYETLTKLSGQGLVLSLSFSSAGVLAIFILLNQYGSATQAAFGVSAATSNFTGDGTFPTIVRLASKMSTITAIFDEGGLPDFATALSYASMNNNGDGRYYSDGIGRLPEDGVLLASVQGTHGDSVNFAGINYETEGFNGTAVCTPVTIQWSATASQRGPDQMAIYTLPLPCTTRTAAYLATESSVWDTHACADGSAIYAFNPTPSNRGMGQVQRCTATLSSALYWVYVDLGRQFITMDREPNDESRDYGTSPLAIIPGSGAAPFFAFLGARIFNHQTDQGFDSLTDYMREYIQYRRRYVPNYSFSPADGSEFLGKWVENMVLGSAVAMSEKLYSVTPREEFGFGRPTVTILREQKVGLKGAQLAWFLLPGALLLILVVLAFFYVRCRSGSVDFTDPLQVAMIGLSSEYDPAFLGAATGKFADKSLYNTRRFKYGTPLYQDPKFAGVPGERLVLAEGTANAGDLGRPSKNSLYV